MTPKKIVICGGSGFLGKTLTEYFTRNGYLVSIVSRSKPKFKCDEYTQWDGRTLDGWELELEGAEAVINMAGRSVDCRYSDGNKKLILDSRIYSTKAMGRGINRCVNPPKVWLNSSTATIYKHSFDKPMDENGEIGATDEAKDAFSIEVARAWEKELENASTPKTRKVALRTAMVMSANKGGVFHVLRRLARTGLGGKMGTGEQFVSWIHEQDFCRAVEKIIDDSDLSGIVNVAAPNPIKNNEMMQIFRQVADASFGLPASKWMLEIGAFFLRTETELIIKSRRVVPGRLLKSGFEFNYPEMLKAVREIESRIE
ncbi:MAG: TIGR01777 family protein [Candidatus Vogelbacteria bacterium]|nr:TIGR01777 family protein [Candidatus Vogelbacteria bacterium]